MTGSAGGLVKVTQLLDNVRAVDSGSLNGLTTIPNWTKSYISNGGTCHFTCSIGFYVLSTEDLYTLDLLVDGIIIDSFTYHVSIIGAVVVFPVTSVAVLTAGSRLISIQIPAGTGVTVNAYCSITIEEFVGANTIGLTGPTGPTGSNLTIIGTTNRVNVSTVGSTITLSTPQDTATSSSPQFLRLSDSSQGSQNVFIGSSSGVGCIGSANTVIGSTSGASIVGASRCIAIGYGALNSASSALTSSLAGHIAVGFAAGLNQGTTSTGGILLGNYAGQNLQTGSDNIMIGNSTQGSSASTNKEIVISTNGTINTPISGRGTNTCFIDARNGLFSFSPAFCQLRATAYDDSIVTWTFWNDGGTTYNNGFALYNSNTLVVQPYPGLYEITLSGQTYVKFSGADSSWSQMNLVTNGIVNYLVIYDSASTTSIANKLIQVSSTQFSRPIISSNPLNTGWAVNVSGSKWYNIGTAPDSTTSLFMTIKFISL
jgi:hypothetical protein